MQTQQLREIAKPTLFQRVRKGVSDFLFLASLASLCVFFGILCFMWIYAWQHGLYPKVPLSKTAIRGPWAYDITLNLAFREVINPLSYAAFSALLSCIIKPNARAGIAFLFCIFGVIVLFLHLGLVDD